MMKLVAELAIAIYITSTLFMLAFFFNAQITCYKRDKKFIKMPISTFLYLHFCPIVHTVKTFNIMRTAARLIAMRKHEV